MREHRGERVRDPPYRAPWIRVRDGAVQTACGSTRDATAHAAARPIRKGRAATRERQATRRPASTTVSRKSWSPTACATSAAYAAAAGSELSTAPAISRPWYPTTQHPVPSLARMNSARRTRAFRTLFMVLRDVVSASQLHSTASAGKVRATNPGPFEGGQGPWADGTPLARPHESRAGTASGRAWKARG
jgi:hypothetical protein